MNIILPSSARKKFISYQLLSFATVFFLLHGGYSKGQDEHISSATQTVTVTVDLSKTYQVIDNFGASDAWSCQFVGNWPDVKKNAIADLLFSKGVTPDGQPKGIGLSFWRFNIGAGSTQQGDQSVIKDEWRRSESFLNSDGTYNWKRQAGQMWFLQAAKNKGVNQFLAFTNSPPVQFTVNGKAYATDGNYYTSKMLWALGNYSRFIRPGSVRVDAASANITAGDNELLVSSYTDQATKQLITVIVNSKTDSVKLKLLVTNGKVKQVRSYVTSSSADLKPGNMMKTKNLMVIQPRTVTTLVGDVKK